MDIDYMASILGVSAQTSTSIRSTPLTLADIQRAKAAMDSIQKPKDFTAAELLSMLRQVLGEFLRMKEELKRTQDELGLACLLGKQLLEKHDALKEEIELVKAQ